MVLLVLLVLLVVLVHRRTPRVVRGAAQIEAVVRKAGASVVRRLLRLGAVLMTMMMNFMVLAVLRKHYFVC